MTSTLALAVAMITALITTPIRYPIYVHDCWDGDTCLVDISVWEDIELTNQRVRLCDINAPERRLRRTRAAALVSRAALLQLVDTATVVQLEPYGRDPFGRVLAHIYVDGINANQLMLDSGHAVPYHKTCSEEDLPQ